MTPEILKSLLTSARECGVAEVRIEYEGVSVQASWDSGQPVVMPHDVGADDTSALDEHINELESLLMPQHRADVRR